MRIIAIDGPAGAGKSTVARTVAQKLGYTYIDTGAMYRGLTWAALQAGLDPARPDAGEGLARLAENTVVRLEADGTDTRVRVDGRDVTAEIRQPETSAAVSYVAANPRVRSRLVALQRELAGRSPVVMDGRDIGTVVFPEADVKVFLTASVEERARRRHAELRRAGRAEPLASVAQNIAARDAMDAGRSAAPLRKAKDAIEIDTTDKTVDEVVAEVLRLVAKKEGSPCTP